MLLDANKISEILYEHWDPIGCGCPKDEYDTYAKKVVQLLTKYPGQWNKVETYLHRSATETMGLSKTPHYVSENGTAALLVYVNSLREQV